MKSKRASGVLLHISSLPSPYGVGVLGEEAHSFCRKLQRMNFHHWQVLPLNSVDDSGSPYCSCSAFAGNIAFIDPRGLYKDGLLTDAELSQNEYPGSIYSTDYDFALKARTAALKTAYSRIDTDTKELVSLFASQNEWVNDYALFMTLRELYGKKPWWEWEKKHALYENAVKCKDEFSREIGFHIFCQYVFFTQYRTLKEFANSLGISIIGDMPIYVSRDSVDVWRNRELFELDGETLLPKEVAGVPPDYFSENGQLWGNPLYNWEVMKKDGYLWWIKRIGFSHKLFDKLRIDHFRAFASYWAVPFESETAKNGRWLKGPGMELFEKAQEALPDCDIIAEDLGIFGEDVVKLLEDSGFPGMRVIQFGFDPGSDSTHLPHNYKKNCIAYLGTHDNNTLLGWLWEASEAERSFALRYCGFNGGNWGDGGFYSRSVRAVTETLWKSCADIVICSIQDMCGFGCDARMNTPGTVENNWKFRISADALNSIDEKYYSELNTVFKRIQ